MSGFLLDTNVLLMGLTNPDQLPDVVYRTLATGPHFLSVVSYWEVMIKSMKGTLEIGAPDNWWRNALDQLAGTSISLRPDHVAQLYRLPPIHKDPFDRILIAQE